MFVGREQELKVLNQQYHSRNFEFSVVYGRRRVGKTTLIKQFCNEHKYIYMMALENNMEENLKALSKAVLQLLSPNESQLVFSSFEQLFDYITPFVMKERIILIMDEYPYLAQSYPSISSLLQKFIRRMQMAKWRSRTACSLGS